MSEEVGLHNTASLYWKARAEKAEARIELVLGECNEIDQQLPAGYLVRRIRKVLNTPEDPFALPYEPRPT